MHFEILVEGQSELTALSILMPSIVGSYLKPHSWRIHKHRGIGKLPDDFYSKPNVNDMTLLHQLPAKIKAYSKYPSDDRVVVVLLDLDDNDKDELIRQLNSISDYCENKIKLCFLFAVEELEAWYMGDLQALIRYNPNINQDELGGYIQDSICGTWEVLAKADDPSFMRLKKRDPRSLDKKKEWAKKIPPHMKIDINRSPSFREFIDKISSYI